MTASTDQHGSFPACFVLTRTLPERTSQEVTHPWISPRLARLTLEVLRTGSRKGRCTLLVWIVPIKSFKLTPDLPSPFRCGIYVRSLRRSLRREPYPGITENHGQWRPKIDPVRIYQEMLHNAHLRILSLIPIRNNRIDIYIYIYKSYYFTPAVGKFRQSFLCISNNPKKTCNSKINQQLTIFSIDLLHSHIHK